MKCLLPTEVFLQLIDEELAAGQSGLRRQLASKPVVESRAGRHAMPGQGTTRQRDGQGKRPRGLKSRARA